MKTVFVSCLLLFTTLSLASDDKPSLKQLASQYMQAYSDWDIEAMSALHSDEVRFDDPTATEVFGRSFAHQGKTQVNAFLKGIFADNTPRYLAFKVHQQYVSGNHVVIHSNFESVLPDSWYGERATGPVFVAIPITTVLVFKDNQIISHTDYADYDSYQQQVNRQLAPAKPTADQP
jgi:limonene-1,2-epoxide hydrolase